MITPADVCVRIVLEPSDTFDVMVEGKRFGVYAVTYNPITRVMHGWGRRGEPGVSDVVVSFNDDTIPAPVKDYLFGLVITRSITF